MREVAQRFADALCRLGPFEPTPHLAVALSGGPDSMALTLLAQAWLQAAGGRLTALTVDHSLREASRSEAEQVAGWMRARGIAHHILTPRHTPAGNNLMQAARQWRYHALSEWCREQGVLHCLLGHQLDDQLETVTMQTARGETEDGGAGMSGVRLYRGVRFLRPLLGERKATLKAWLQAEQAPWVEDPTNADPAYARTRTRQELAGAELQQLQQALEEKRAERAQRELAVARAAARVVVVHPAGFARLDRAGWLELPAPLRSQLLADLVTTIGGQIHRPRRHETSWLEETLHAFKGTQTLGQCLIYWTEDQVIVAREPARVEPPVTLQGEGVLLWDQRFRVHYTLATSLTLAALGERGRKLLGDKTLPLATPALWHLDELCAVPHIRDKDGLMLGFAPAKPLAARAFW